MSKRIIAIFLTLSLISLISIKIRLSIKFYSKPFHEDH
ncbi:putative membrane protein [Wolbachia pipientis wVitA]|nr:putative membrane protein [Wolbachia phage WO]ONI57179.1 putative membrane protein [Wolbachia pipientis wVitA]